MEFDLSLRNSTSFGGNDTGRPPDIFSQPSNDETMDFELGWLSDANNNDNTSLMDNSSTIISDLFVFDDLNSYMSKFNSSVLVNFSSYYDLNDTYASVDYSCVSNSTAGNYSQCGVEGKDETKNWWALILVIVPCLTVFGNVLVILAVKRERTLKSITNYFIVSLAVADLLVAMVVMPFAVYVLVSFFKYVFPIIFDG
ncbi:hypothetical protein QAD02_008700 [Eretmocerus hayati]|uniref:Uncharacterized protein n=1 Tax=Eretmocerus hayati TaxID=131215 RepID=A0ACC2N8G9_9HYME|nr:hypothetical protein QAD02_008700 [Eretmocerus hayati]